MTNFGINARLIFDTDNKSVSTKLIDVNATLLNHETSLAEIATQLGSYPRITPEVNDTGRFSRAIATLTNGGALFIPKGTFTGYMDIPYSNVTIYGVGNASILKLPDGANRDIIRGLGVSNINIYNLSFDGNADNNTVTQTPATGENNLNDAIYLSKGDNYNIHHCSFKNTRGNAINLYQVTSVRIESNHVDTCNRIDQNGITVQFATGTGANGGIIANNFIKNNPTGMGMSCFSVNELTVMGNTVLDCSVGYGFEWGSSKWVFTGNKSIRCNKGAVLTLRTSSGLLVDKGIISNNLFLECAGSTSGSVQISGLRNVLFKGNIVTGGAYDGIYASNLQDCTFEGNEVSGATKNGIYILGDTPSKSLTIKNNTVFGCGNGTTGNGIFVDKGSQIFLKDNEVYNNKEQGMKLQTITDLVIQGNVVYDNQTTKTQQFGIFYSGCTNVYEANNIAFGNQYQPDIKNGGTNTNIVSRNKMYKDSSRTSKPTGGTWEVGDMVLNSAPTNGSPYGWVCVTAGSPGTWKAFGIISDSVKGTHTSSGDGTFTRYIAHGLGVVPTYLDVQAGSTDAGTSQIKHVTADATNITIVFANATVAGTNNLVVYWKAEV